MQLNFVHHFKNLQLDIVGFLAILGEGSVEANAQAATLSWFTLVPRLIPAPQVFLKPSRPDALEPSVGKVVGVYSGNYREHVNYIGHLIHHGDDLAAYQVQWVEITRVENAKQIHAKVFGPLTFLVIVGFVESVALLVLSVVFDDGMALLATILLSFLSTLVGIGNKWTLTVQKRTQNNLVPDGDVIVKYPKGSLLVIKCEEAVARALYFAPEETTYLLDNPQQYRLLASIGTLMLMFGVIMLANAKLKMQICFGAAYIILNAVYWIVAAIKRHHLWDTNEFKLDYLTHKGSDEFGITQHKSFTQALWMGIKITRTVNWIRWGFVAPQGPAWEKWINQAHESIKTNPMDDPPWEPQAALIKLLDEERNAFIQSTTNSPSMQQRHPNSWPVLRLSSPSPRFATA